jgi:hypothetical protein
MKACTQSTRNDIRSIPRLPTYPQTENAHSFFTSTGLTTPSGNAAKRSTAVTS